MMVVERQASGKAKVIAREEVKTGGRDTNADARGQLDDQTGILRDAAAGKKTIRLEVGDRDIISVALAGGSGEIRPTRSSSEPGLDPGGRLEPGSAERA
jgi:hypothetical protein